MKSRAQPAPSGLDDRELSLWLLAHRTRLTETDCLIWTGHISAVSGYGVLSRKRKMFRPHRFIKAALHGGPPESSLHAAHQCSVRACVNPEHIEWQTAKENLLDENSIALAALNSRKPQCPTCGSVYSIDRNAQRYCRPCRLEWQKSDKRRAYMREYYLAHRENLLSRKRIRDSVKKGNT